VSCTTQAGRPYDDRAVQNDVRKLWSTGRFDDIRVEAKPAADGVSLTYRVHETPEAGLREVRILPTSFGLRLKPLQGALITTRRAQQIALKARTQLHAKGYPGARVDYNIVLLSRHQADLRLMVQRGQPVEVKAVEFLGDPGLNLAELRGSLRALRICRVIPGIPGLWNG
jgi:outer membrane protein assembly factor BamA